MRSGLPWSENKDGIGGHKHLDTEPGVSKTPIVFVHGNSDSHLGWNEHINYLLEREYTGDELWAVNIPNNKLTHRAFATRIEEFVENVLTYTGTDNLCVVSHSMGVTSSRYWLKEYQRYNNVDVFVGIAGANHGIPIAPPDVVSKNLPDNSTARPCEFLSQFSLEKDYSYEELNKESETPGDIEYYTIRGTKDRFYSLDPDSPKLDNACCNIEIEEDHFGARDSDVSKELVYQWCQ